MSEFRERESKIYRLAVSVHYQINSEFRSCAGTATKCTKEVPSPRKRLHLKFPISNADGNGNGNGSKNVTWKVNLRSFKLNFIALIAAFSICQMSAIFSGVEF